MADVLDIPFSCTVRPNRSARKAILDSVWQGAQHIDQDLLTSLIYFYDQTTSAASHVGNAISSHHQFIDLCSFIQRSHERSKAELRTETRAKFEALKDCSDRDIDEWLDLCARVHLLINIRDKPFSSPGQSILSWPSDKTIKDIVHMRFQLSQQSNSDKIFSNTFNLQALQEIGGFSIIWSNNLLDHLSFDNHKQLQIFHHASFLQCCHNSVYPSGLAEETLSTLILLLPSTNDDVRAWFKREMKVCEKKGVCLDPQANNLHRKHSKASDFSYWRERLLLLEEEFINTQPWTIRQWWRDRRNRVQWATFWSAVLILILTIFFGVVQSVSSIVQAWASVRALNLQSQGQ